MIIQLVACKTTVWPGASHHECDVRGRAAWWWWINPLPSSSHGSSSPLPSPRLRQKKKAFFSLLWWTGYILSLVQSKTEFYFLSASPPQPVSKNVFCIGFGRPGVFLSVWMCIYYCTCVEEQNGLMFVFCVLVLFQCMLFYVWMVRSLRSVRHFFNHWLLHAHLFVFYAFFWTKTFLISSQ